jgi:hypothetical protein
MKLMKLGGAEGEERDVHETDKNAYKILYKNMKRRETLKDAG